MPELLPKDFAKWARLYFNKELEVESIVDLSKLFENDFTRVLASISEQLENARKITGLDKEITRALEEAKQAGAPENISKLQELVTYCSNELKARREAVEAELTRTYEAATIGNLDLKRDPNEARDTIRGFLRSWDIEVAETASNLFKEQVERAKSRQLDQTDTVQTRFEAHKLQNDRFARNTHQALMIATRAIGSDGKIELGTGEWDVLKEYSTDNLGALIKEIKSGKHKNLPQSEHALAMMQKLLKDKDLREKLESITKPTDSESDAAKLIRATLGLKPDEEITDVHARQAALSSLMFQARQGKAGSCFATATACMVQRNRPERFLEDIKSLFDTGKLVRTIGGKRIELPINKTVLQSNLEKKTEVPRKDSTLYMAPEMVAVMSNLNIPADEQKRAFELATRELRCEAGVKEIANQISNPKKSQDITNYAMNLLKNDTTLSITDALHQACRNYWVSYKGTSPYDNEDQSDAFKPEDIIAKMVQQRVTGAEEQKKAIKAAKDAFLGQQDNLLMRCWEYTIATSGEKHTGSSNYKTKHSRLAKGYANLGREFIRDELYNSIFLKRDRRPLLIMTEKLMAEFQKLLESKTETRYDPSVKTKSQAVALDGHSSSGGFALFVGDKKIESEADYQAAMEVLIREARQNIDGELNKYLRGHADTFVNLLSREFGKSSFHQEIIKEICHGDKKKMNKMAKPWTIEGGSYEDDIMQVYFGTSTRPNVKEKKDANNAEELAEFLLKTMKDMGVDKRLKPGQPWEESSIPVANGLHAFNLIPSTPGISMLLKGYEDPQEGLKAFKKNEEAKNKTRGNHEFTIRPTMDPALVALIERAVSIFSDSKKDAARLEVIGKFTGDTIKAKDVAGLLETAVRAAYITAYGNNSQIDKWVNESKKRVEKTQVPQMLSLVPKEEFEPLVNICLERLKVPEEKQEDLAKDILAQLSGQDTIERSGLETLVKTTLENAEIAVEEGSIKTALQYRPGLVFADMNWGGGDHRTLASMIVNPLTGNMELWEMNEEGTSLKKMDQKEWIESDSWWRVYDETKEYEGLTGDNEWEEARGNARAKIEDCTSKKVGDIAFIQSILEIADGLYDSNKKDEAKNALKRIVTLADAALQLAQNREEAVNGVKAVLAEVEKVRHEDTAVAKKSLETFIKSLETLSTEEDRDDLIGQDGQYLELSNLLKTANDPLGVAVDIDTILKKTA